MNLLPKSKIEFSSKAYWEDFFEKRKHTFEWYGEYQDLRQILEKYCKVDDKILMSGCGNSNLSEEMYGVGFHNIVNIDTSDTVLKQMNSKSNGRMPYLKMDMMKTTFNESNFNVVIDKGTLDAIFADDIVEIAVSVREMFTEILRVLKVIGRYICITLAQDHILNELLSFFPKWGFVRVHEIKIKEVDGLSGLGSNLPIFAFICTKMKSELSSPVLEMVFSGNVKVEKFKVIEEVQRNIKTLQDFALVKSKLESFSLDEEIMVELWSNDVSRVEPRYSLTVIDIGKYKLSKYNGDFAVFIVPNGRENNSTFATKAGRNNLVEAAGFTRLVIACLHRGHVYKDLQEIKCELSEKVMDLAPSHVDKKVQVPFLSTSSDIGNRVVVYEDESSFYGKFVVEDVQGEQQYYYRQLILTKESDRVQTKTRLMSESNKKKKKRRIPDHRYLMQVQEKSMLAGFLFLSSLDFQNLEKMDVLIFGLGNISFINYLLYLLPDVHVTCVDVDPHLLDVCTTWFRLYDTDRFTFIHKDIFTFSDDCQHGLYDVVILDQTSLNDSCNLDEEVFTKAKCALKKYGVLMYVQTHLTNSVEGFNRYVDFFHFESEENEEALVQFYVKCDISLNDAWGQAKLKSKVLVEYIMAIKKGFYDKHEWSSLVGLVERLGYSKNSLQ